MSKPIAIKKDGDHREGALTEEEKLFKVHKLRMQAHWGKNYDISKNPWPKSEKEWREVDHGSPADTNVHMAKWHLKLAQKIKDEGLLQ